MPSTARLTWDSRDEAPLPLRPASTHLIEIVGGEGLARSGDRLVRGDNLAGMQALLAQGGVGSMDLAYLDPPFVSRARYTQAVILPDGQSVNRPVFDDTWPSLDAWLDMLYPRLRLVHALLADTGSLYLHLDWRAADYARVLLDEIFGADAFRNEIVWKRAALLGRKAASGQYGRVTDSLLFYTKSDRFTFNRLSVERETPRAGARWDAEAGRWYRTAPSGDYTEQSLAGLAEQGRIHQTRTGRRRVKYFLTETADGRLVDQVPLDNLWLDIPDMMHLPPAERTGYPTQKPLALLQRIIRVSSNPGDRVLDPFAGAGTTLVASAQLGRRWTGLEASAAGVAVTRARLLEQGRRGFDVLEVGGEGAGGPSGAGEADQDRPTFEVQVRPDDAGEHLCAVAVRSSPDTARPHSLEYWAVDWQYDGMFRSDWQGWRGYGRVSAAVPAQATAPLPKLDLPIAIRWETLDGQSGLEIVGTRD